MWVHFAVEFLAENMLQVFLFLLIFIDFSWISHGKRLRKSYEWSWLVHAFLHGMKYLGTFQSQHELGELCMPGTCVSINANCKRIIGGSFRCVCKDQYLAVNRTHCRKIRFTIMNRYRNDLFSSNYQSIDWWWLCVMRRKTWNLSGWRSRWSSRSLLLSTWESSLSAKSNLASNLIDSKTWKSIIWLEVITVDSIELDKANREIFE